jgi:elongation factor 1 alpha-like protein
LAESVGSLVIEETRIKSKNLNVVDEFEKSNPKRIANFVVMGKFDVPRSLHRMLDLRHPNTSQCTSDANLAQVMSTTAKARSWVAFYTT